MGRESARTLYPDCRAMQAKVEWTHRVRYSTLGPTNLLHRLGFSCQLTSPVSCEADSARQAALSTSSGHPC